MQSDLDVRSLTTEERYEQVSAAFRELAEGDQLRIVIDHEPFALRMLLGRSHPGTHLWRERTLGEDYWEATIWKTAPPCAEATPVAVAIHCSWLFHGLTAGDREKLAAGSQLRRLPAKSTVAEQGADWPHLGLVSSGSIVAVASTEAGRDYLLYETLPFDVFGELQALDTGITIGRFDTGDTETEIVTMPRDMVLALADSDGKFARRLATVCAQRGRLLHQALYARIAKSTITRLAAAILPYATRTKGFGAALPPLPSMTQAELARAAGTVKDVIGRDLAALHAAGAIKLRGGRVAQVDEARLRTFL